MTTTKGVLHRIIANRRKRKEGNDKFIETLLSILIPLSADPGFVTLNQDWDWKTAPASVIIAEPRHFIARPDRICNIDTEGEKP